MILHFLYNIISSKNLTLKQKIIELKKNYEFYTNLKKLLKNDELYQICENQENSLIEFTSKFTKDDNKLLKQLFENDVKNKLKKNKLKTKINFKSDEDFKQIGYGTIFVKGVIQGLWTTGKSTFYLPIWKRKENRLKIELYSIPPIMVNINIENNFKRQISLTTLSSKSIFLTLPKDNCNEEICQITIKTDKLWFPHKIIKSNEIVLLGVGIKSISNVT